MKAQALLGGWVFLKYLKSFSPLRVSQFEDRQDRGWAHNCCIMVPLIFGFGLAESVHLQRPCGWKKKPARPLYHAVRYLG